MEEPKLNSELFAAHISSFTFLFKFSSDPNTESTGGFYYTSIDGLGSRPKLGRLLWICVFLFFWERVRPSGTQSQSEGPESSHWTFATQLLWCRRQSFGPSLIHQRAECFNISVEYSICEWDFCFCFHIYYCKKFGVWFFFKSSKKKKILLCSPGVHLFCQKYSKTVVWLSPDQAQYFKIEHWSGESAVFSTAQEAWWTGIVQLTLYAIG
jgi:hypothetical protein